MHELDFLLNMTLILTIGAASTLIFKKFKLPSIVGYLVTGIILAKYWMGQSGDSHLMVEILANLGLVLLMFCIGMELNLKKLRKTGRLALTVAMIQLPIILIGGYLLGIMMGWDPLLSLFFAAAISGSSTAVVTAVLAGYDKITREEAETIILVTVIDDVVQVLIFSMTAPLLVGSSMDLGSISIMLVSIVGFITVSMLVGLLAVPRALDWIGERMPEEVLLVTAVGMCFALAFASVYIGLSMAIGAFLMGVIVSQSRTAKVIERDITPMKDIFMAVFFISIGFKILPMDIYDNLLMIIIIFLIYVALKMFSVFTAYFVANKTMRVAFISSVGLVVMGEFAFIISKAAYDADIMPHDIYTSIIGAALLSMIVMPIMSRYADTVCVKASEYAPGFLYNGVRKVEKVRSDWYMKMALSSRSTAEKFSRNITSLYLELIALSAMILVFFFTTPILAQTVVDLAPALDPEHGYLIVLAVQFLIYLVPLYLIVNNVKFAEKVMLDKERRAERLGIGDLDSRTSRFHRSMVRTNTWLMVLLFDLLILAVMMINIDVWTHLIGVLSDLIGILSGLIG